MKVELTELEYQILKLFQSIPPEDRVSVLSSLQESLAEPKASVSLGHSTVKLC